MIYKNTKFNKGYTLLFAVLVSSLVLAVGISILNISKKEFLLASSARESTVAFYSADSALECVVYHDLEGFFDNSSSIGNINCMGTDFGVSIKTPPGISIFTTNIAIDSSIGSCAIVTVEKDATGTKIESRGYNVGWIGDNIKTCSAISPRKVERALYYSY